jgi:hypothetical protein
MLYIRLTLKTKTTLPALEQPPAQTKKYKSKVLEKSMSRLFFQGRNGLLCLLCWLNIPWFELYVCKMRLTDLEQGWNYSPGVLCAPLPAGKFHLLSVQNNVQYCKHVFHIYLIIYFSSLEFINVEVKLQRNYWQRNEPNSYKLTLSSMAKVICDLAFLNVYC